VAAARHRPAGWRRPAAPLGAGHRGQRDGGARDEWLFSPRTLRYVGERSINVSTGQVGGSSAIVVQAFVDHVGDVPPGS
jgi:hypothetical protein